MMLSNTLNVPLVKESNLGTPTPYSSHRDTGKSSRRWTEVISSNGTVPNITSNPNFSDMSEDVWKKNNDARVGNFGLDNSGILRHKTILSETQEQDTSKAVDTSGDNFDDHPKNAPESTFIEKILGLPRSLFGK